jgi:hypothetical protein
MMRSPLRAVALAAALAAFFPTAGCLRYQEELVVLPDGSGKMVLSVGFNLEILEKFKEMGMDPSEQEEEMGIDLEDLEEFEGIVAMTRPKSEKKDTWKTWTFTAYFEDLNKVRLTEKRADETKRTKVSFAFRKEGDGYALEIDDRFAQNEQLKSMEDMPEEGAEAAWEMAKQFLKGFEMTRAIRMPGPVTSSEGFAKKEGRVASNRIDESSLKGMEDMKKAMKTEKRKLACGPNEMSEGDVSAFKKELEQAKAEWPKIKEELIAEAKKKKVKKDE